MSDETGIPVLPSLTHEPPPGEAAPSSRRCVATARTGQRCKAWTRTGSEYCLAHDPDSVEVIRAAGRKGGHNRRHPPLKEARYYYLDNEEAIFAVCSETAFRLITGEMDLPTAKARNTACETSRKTLELRETRLAREAKSDRLDALEAAVVELTKGRK